MAKRKKEKRESLNDRIKDILGLGPMAALYFVVGIDLLKEKLDGMTNKEVTEMFANLLHPDRVRNNVDTIHKKLNGPIEPNEESTKWSKTNDYYDRKVVTEDVWSRKCKRGMVYVIDKPSFTYTFSCGANSEYSFTGCFFGCSKITTVQEAMVALDEIAARWLNNKEIASILKKYE